MQASFNAMHGSANVDPSGTAEPAAHTQVRGVLRELQQALKGGSGYVLGQFTYADIVMAVSMLYMYLLNEQGSLPAGC